CLQSVTSALPVSHLKLSECSVSEGLNTKPCCNRSKSTHQNQTHECLYRYAVHTSSPTRRLHHQNQPATRHYRRSWSQPSQVDRSNHCLQPCSTPFGRARVMGWGKRGGSGAVRPGVKSILSVPAA